MRNQIKNCNCTRGITARQDPPRIRSRAPRVRAEQRALNRWRIQNRRARGAQLPPNGILAGYRRLAQPESRNGRPCRPQQHRQTRSRGVRTAPLRRPVPQTRQLNTGKKPATWTIQVESSQAAKTTITVTPSKKPPKKGP